MLTNWTYKKRMSVIFRRTNFLREYRDFLGNLKETQPRYLQTNKETLYTEYVYSIPLGKVLTDSLEKAIVGAFDRVCKVKSAGGRLYVRIYKYKLPDHVAYEQLKEINVDTKYTVPIGLTLDDLILHNFDVTPHMTVAGATRQGKTVFLKQLITYLCENNPTEDIRLYLIDLKGGLEFGRYADLKQTVRVASNAYETAKLLEEVQSEMNRNMSVFRKLGYTNIVDTPIKTRTFVIVDEAAQLSSEPFMQQETKEQLGYCQHALSEITRIGGALGYRLVFATQYPTSDTLPRQIKQNADAKLSFRLTTELASRVAIDEEGAEKLTVPGRAIYRTIDKVEVQVPYISDKESEERLAKFKEVDQRDGASYDKVSRTDDDDPLQTG
ncbi:FtsK/SpoIIIE domain-containing protein [Virgibacillus salexigens]|uniref:Cell division protein FtsK n=1 Tax=Virgibacillus kapii TaxID=1638645 RepID=A0ABQ2D9Z6_9BACI|nr:FtsK/SpoIIIE domain-containing protein [Virgibacillus kapii]GGJ49576.1 cell division protein FtsK [Virgibacillus kapii]